MFPTRTRKFSGSWVVRRTFVCFHHSLKRKTSKRALSSRNSSHKGMWLQSNMDRAPHMFISIKFSNFLCPSCCLIQGNHGNCSPEAAEAWDTHTWRRRGGYVLLADLDWGHLIQSCFYLGSDAVAEILNIIWPKNICRPSFCHEKWRCFHWLTLKVTCHLKIFPLLLTSESPPIPVKIRP